MSASCDEQTGVVSCPPRLPPRPPATAATAQHPRQPPPRAEPEPPPAEYVALLETELLASLSLCAAQRRELQQREAADAADALLEEDALRGCGGGVGKVGPWTWSRRTRYRVCDAKGAADCDGVTAGRGGHK